MKKIILALFTISALLVAFTNTARAEIQNMPSTGIQIYCDPSKGELRFNAETVYDEWSEQFIREARERNLFFVGKFSFQCDLGTTKIKLWGKMYKPSERGECGGNPGGKIFVSVNGIPILHFLTFGNACSATVWRGAITVHR